MPELQKPSGSEQGRILFSLVLILASVEERLRTYIVDDVMLTDYA